MLKNLDYIQALRLDPWGLLGAFMIGCLCKKRASRARHFLCTFMHSVHAGISDWIFEQKALLESSKHIRQDSVAVDAAPRVPLERLFWEAGKWLWRGWR